MSEEPTERELLWRQYEVHIDVYKFHMNGIIKSNAVYFAIVGTILGVFFSGLTELGKWLLLLPIAISMANSVFMAYGIVLVQERKKALRNIKEKLGMEIIPDMTLLQIVTGALAFVHLGIIIGFALLIAFFQVDAVVLSGHGPDSQMEVPGVSSFLCS